MTRLTPLVAATLAVMLTATTAFADGHKPGCRGLDPATQSTNSACED